MSNILKMALAGLISGILSYFSIKFFNLAALYVLVGFLYGSALLISVEKIIKKQKYHLLRAVIFILLSVLANYAASMTALRGHLTVLSLLTGGFVGSFILCTGFFLIYRLISPRFLLFWIFLGTILSLSWFVLADNSIIKDYGLFAAPWERFLVLYLVWQTGMAAALGWAIERKK